MKIQLKYPYTIDYCTGYLRVNKENRQTVYLIKHRQSKVTNSTAYARYLLAVKYKRYLTNKEHADHIDKDKTNDNINNLQILTIEEHRKKTNEESRKSIPTRKCLWCSKEFTPRRPSATTKTCSRRCGGKLSHL